MTFALRYKNYERELNRHNIECLPLKIYLVGLLHFQLARLVGLGWADPAVPAELSLAWLAGWLPSWLASRLHRDRNHECGSNPGEC